MRRVLVIALAAMALASPAAAQPAPSPGPSLEERAQALFVEGTTHFNVAEYDEAIASYKEAYKLVQEPLFLYNIAQAYRQKKDCEGARTFYRNYLRDAPRADNRAKVERRITEMDACVAAQPAPIQPAVTEPTTTEPTTTEPTTTEPTTTEPTTTEPVTTEPIVVAPEPQPMPRDRGRTLRLAGTITGVAGVVVLGAGAYFSLQARGLSSELEERCAVTCTSADVADHDRRGSAADRNATIAYITGGVAIGAGVGLYLMGRARHERSPIALVPTARGVAVAGSF